MSDTPTTEETLALARGLVAAMRYVPGDGVEVELLAGVGAMAARLVTMELNAAHQRDAAWRELDQLRRSCTAAQLANSKLRTENRDQGLELSDARAFAANLLRVRELRRLLDPRLYALTLTKDGEPGHLLFVRATVPPVPIAQLEQRMAVTSRLAGAR